MFRDRLHAAVVDVRGLEVRKTSRLPRAPAVSIESLSWMVGAWTGKMGKAGIEEHWIPPAGKTMMAVARTVVGDRTVAFEFLRIEQRPDAIVYIAQPGGRPPTEFRLTASTPTSATFENPQHDHPETHSLHERRGGHADRRNRG